MSLLGTAISVGGSLLGGLFGRNSKKKEQARQQEYDKPLNVRARYEEAGINPLLAFSGGVVGQSQPVASDNFMGSAISDASMMVANKLTSSAHDKATMQNLNLQNEKLQKEINRMTLRPATVGMYQRPLTTEKPSISQDKAEFFGPNPATRLYNPAAGQWVSVHPDVASRLDLKDGQSLIAEDYEAILGDVGSEFINLPNLANEAFGSGNIFNKNPKGFNGFKESTKAVMPKLTKPSPDSFGNFWPRGAPMRPAYQGRRQ